MAIHSLTVYIDENYIHSENLHEAYQQHMHNHNYRGCLNQGFDLLIPDTLVSSGQTTLFVDHHVKCVLKSKGNHNDMNEPSAYYVYGSPGLLSTHLRLANSVEIMGSFDMCACNVVATFDVKPEAQAGNILAYPLCKLVRICAPDLKPIYVTIAPAC